MDTFKIDCLIPAELFIKPILSDHSSYHFQHLFVISPNLSQKGSLGSSDNAENQQICQSE